MLLIRTLFALSLFIATNTYAGLDDLSIESPLRGDYVIGVMTHDQRPLVLKDGYPEKQIGGYIKGMFRTRAGTYTNSDGPVADELSEGLRGFFVKQKWLGVTTLATSSNEARTVIEARIKKAALKRTVLVTINDLWTESYRNTSVTYSFSIAVVDSSGVELAKAEHTGIHDTSQWGDEAASEIFSKLIMESLAKPEFTSALRG